MDSHIESFWAGTPWSIPGTPWNIIGYSRASYRTGFYIKALDLMIDAGPQKTGNPKTILITHCHADHIANIPFTLIASSDAQIPVVFVHTQSHSRLKNYIESMFAANYNQDFKGSVANYIPVEPPNSINYCANNIQIKIDVFDCIHDVPTVSYGISTKQQRLKEEYFNLKGDGKALTSLRKQGIEVTNTVYIPNIVFVWDTTVDILVINPRILEFPVIMIECSFIMEDDYEQSLTKKHIHWKSLKPYVVDNPKIFFVLVHFSLRYTETEIADFFQKEQLPNVKPWLQLR
jgi:ribonuclease Z